jgi:hypothetical protein
VILLVVLVVALALYCYRNRLVEWFRGNQIRSAGADPAEVVRGTYPEPVIFRGACGETLYCSLFLALD